MELSHSTFYNAIPVPLDAERLLPRIGAICDEFECYGYRRVGVALRHVSKYLRSRDIVRLCNSSTSNRRCVCKLLRVSIPCRTALV